MTALLLTGKAPAVHRTSFAATSGLPRGENVANATPTPQDIIRHLPEDARSRLAAVVSPVVTRARTIVSGSSVDQTWTVEQRTAQLVNDVPIPWAHG